MVQAKRTNKNETRGARIMLMTAKSLGAEYGLNAEEMNRVLVKLGFLTGTPGDYELTPLGKQYANTECYHRGPGGYSMYNRDWIIRKFDESIKDVLEITSDLKNEVRMEIADARAARNAAMKAARAKADADFLAKEAAKKAAEIAEQARIREELERADKLKKYGKIGIVVTGGALAGFGVYKLIKYVKSKKEVKEQKNAQEG